MISDPIDPPLELVLGGQAFPVARVDCRQVGVDVPLVISGDLLEPVVELEERDGKLWAGLRRAPDATVVHHQPGPSLLFCLLERAVEEVERGWFGAIEGSMLSGAAPFPFEVRRRVGGGVPMKGTGFIRELSHDGGRGIMLELVVTGLVSGL